jgi:hypothetical protein
MTENDWQAMPSWWRESLADYAWIIEAEGIWNLLAIKSNSHLSRRNCLDDVALRWLREGYPNPFIHCLNAYVIEPEYPPSHELTGYLSAMLRRKTPVWLEVKRRSGTPGTRPKRRANNGIIASLEDGDLQPLLKMLDDLRWSPEMANYLANMLNEDGDTPYTLEKHWKGKRAPSNPESRVNANLAAMHYEGLRMQGVSPRDAMEDTKKMGLSEAVIKTAVTQHRKIWKSPT